MIDTCVSFSAWMPYGVCLALVTGVALGFLLRCGIDYAELRAYRRLARGQP
jgi:hypothetical protein